MIEIKIRKCELISQVENYLRDLSFFSEPHDGDIMGGVSGIAFSMPRKKNKEIVYVSFYYEPLDIEGEVECELI